MKIVSFNINSIRARPHQLIHLRDTIDPDVIGIQETKVNDPEFPIDEIKEIGYHPEFWGQKGHYGVAILSKKKPENVQKNKEVISLNLANRRVEKEERQLWALDIENKRRASLNLETFNSYESMQDYNDAKENEDDERDSEIDVENDYLLNEGMQILSDYTIFYQNIFLSKAA